MPHNHRRTLTRRKFLRGLSASTLAASAVGRLDAAVPTPRVPGPQVQEKQVEIGIVGGGFGASFQWHLDPNVRWPPFAIFETIVSSVWRMLTARRRPTRTFGSF